MVLIILLAGTRSPSVSPEPSQAFLVSQGWDAEMQAAEVARNESARVKDKDEVLISAADYNPDEDREEERRRVKDDGDSAEPG